MTQLSHLACPDLATLEQVLAGIAINADVLRHLDGCQTCRTEAERIKANNRLIGELLEASMSRRSAPLRPVAHDAVAGFEIAELISQGGQGAVYKAIQTSTRREVALKVLFGGAFSSPRHRARFEREVELAGSLRHPNIVTVYDSGMTRDGRLYMAMEYVVGKPLHEFAAANQVKGRPVRELLRLFARICAGVEYAHLRGVIHRDLKPANILIDAAGEPRILDFGLAKLTGVEAIHTTELTHSGEFMGTFAYASPEQAQGVPDRIDLRTDVYSLGVMLYELLTGQRPYPTGRSMAEAIHNLAEVDPVRPSKTRPAINDEVDTLVLKALAKSPEERYATAGDLRRDIEHYLNGEPLDAKRDSTWYVIRGALRRHRRRLLAVSIGTAAIVFALIAIVTYKIFSAQAAAERALATSESEHAAALSLVIQSVSRMPGLAGISQDYSANGLARLNKQLRLGWIGDRRRLESNTTALLSTIYRDGGSTPFAEQLVREMLVHRRLELGQDHPEISQGLYDLAETLLLRDRLPEAEQHCRSALAAETRNAGEKGLGTARGKELLARIRLAQGDSRTAAKLAAAAVATLSNLPGDLDVQRAQALDTQSQAELSLGEFDRAETDCMSALHLRLAFLPDEHPQVAQSLNHLALILGARSGAAGDLALATVFGAQNFAGLALGLRTLAADLEQLGKPLSNVATHQRPVLHTMLALKSATLGGQHRGLLSTMAALIQEADEREDLNEIARLLGLAATIIEKSVGENSLALANCLEDRAEALIGLGQLSDATQNLGRSVDIWWSLPPESRDEFQAAVNERALGMYLAYAGHYAEGEARLRHAIEAFTRNQGPEHHTIALARSMRAWAIAHLGRLDEAETEARAALAQGERLKSVMPSDQHLFQKFYLASILAAGGKYDEAEPVLKRTWDGAEEPLYAFKGRRPPDRPRDILIEDMIRICGARGDAVSEARWQAELPMPTP